MRYCPYFCEENVWHLCSDDTVGIPLVERRAVFVTNEARQVRMRHQRAGNLVVWDYHVVLMGDGRVWDLDCTLGMPLGLDEWLGTVDDSAKFRVVDASEFVRTFASDRSHMQESGHRLPEWPPIGHGMNLLRFIDLADPIAGVVVDKAGLRRIV
jgi:protein N-terminal glutamine amidohydrolase